MNVPFNEQVRILQNELFKTFDYIAIDDFYTNVDDLVQAVKRYVEGETK